MRRRAFLSAGLALPAIAHVGAACSVESTDKLLVVDSLGSALLVLDGRTFAKVGRVPLERRPREIALSPTGSMAYVSIYGPGIYGNNARPGHELIAIDTATQKVKKRISLAPHSGPHGMAVAPDGRIWVTADAEGSLLLVDPATMAKTKAVAAIVPVGVKGPYWVAITPDGSKVYATNKSHPVLSVINVHERKLIQEIKAPRGLEGLAITPDGRRLFAADLGRATLWVVDIAEDRVVREHPLEEPASRILALPDGSGLLVTHEESGTVEFLEIPTLRRRGIAKVGKSPAGITVSSDNRMGFVASWASGTIAVIDINSLRVIRTISVGGAPDGLAWVGTASL